GVDEGAIRAKIESVLGHSEQVAIQQIMLTSRVKKVIELSSKIAQREGSRDVSPVHMLLSLMEEGEGIAAHGLEFRRVTPDVVTGLAGAPRAWLQPGGSVLVHDPEPPYRLWEGTVSRYGDGLALVS